MEPRCSQRPSAFIPGQAYEGKNTVLGTWNSWGGWNSSLNLLLIRYKTFLPSSGDFMFLRVRLDICAMGVRMPTSQGENVWDKRGA